MADAQKAKVIAICVIIGVLLAVFVGLISSSLKKLNSDQIGLTYDNIAKSLDTNAKAEGLHFGPPGFSFIIFPSVFQNMEFNGISCLNRDGVVIELAVSCQFKANPNYLKVLVDQFTDFDGYKKVLSASGSSAVHDTCANFSTTEFQSDRGKFQEQLRNTMRKYCESLYCELNELQVNKLQRPVLFETAVKEKEAAKENIRVAENERPRLILQAQTEFEQASKQAQIILNNAETDARIIQNKAENEAKSIDLQYKKDLEVYKQLKTTQNLDNEALLAYLAIKAISNSKNDINLAMKSPASTSYTGINDNK